MEYPFSKHWFCFTDMGEVYQNVFENMTGLTTQWESGNGNDPSTDSIVDPIVSAYAGINQKLGVDFDVNNATVRNQYLAEYTNDISTTQQNILIVLGTIQAGLDSNLISSPVLKLQGAVASNTQGVLAKTESVISKVASGAGTVLENIGAGIENTSAAIKYLPEIIGAGLIAYYFLMVVPKNKKG